MHPLTLWWSAPLLEVQNCPQEEPKPKEQTVSDDFKPGLEGVIAFESEIAEPDKEGSALRYRGVDIE